MNRWPSTLTRDGRAHARRLRRAFAAAAIGSALIASAPFAAAQPSAAPSSSASAPAIDEARVQAHKEALSRANAATLGVEATAVEGARSISTLGYRRQGSGVLIGNDGLVVTIGYLILEADHVDLVHGDGRRVPARVVAYDLASGFGLLQALAPVGVAPAPLGTSGRVSGDEPLMIASGGAVGDVSLARMVSRRAFSGYWEYHIEGALFTAPPRTDHSGAGLFNADGELIGVGSLIVGDALGTQSPVRGNMFVPVDLLKSILPELRERGASRGSTRPWIGLNCVEYQGQVRVLRLTPEGPAEEAGVQPGDAIVSVDGTPIADLAGFYRALWQGERPERKVALEIRRGSRSLQLELQAVDRMKTLSRPGGV